MAYDGEGKKPGRSPGLVKRAKKMLERSTACFKDQQRMIPLWQAQAEIFYPEMADFQSEISDPVSTYKGIFTSLPQILSRTLGERIGSMTRAKGEPWFKLTALPEDLMEKDDVKLWCEDSTKRQRNVLYAGTSGFSVAMSLGDRSYATFGNDVMEYGYNQKRDGVFFQACHLRDCAWFDSAEGITNEMHRKMKPTLTQARDLFGIDNLPKEWRDKLDDPKMAGHRVEIHRCVAPLDEYAYDDGEKPRKAAKFASIYIACGVKDEEIGLAEGFLDHFPYCVRRWLRLPGQVYARSPAVGIALADGGTLNTAEMALLKGIELKVSPPRTAIDDGIVGDIRLQADGITFIDRDYNEKTGKPIDTLEVGEPKYGMEYIQKKAAEMAKACFMDLLQLPDRKMTLGEFRQRFKNALRDAAPVFEPIEADYSQLMDGVFDLIIHAHGPADPWGGFLPAPDALSPENGGQVRYEFETALSEAFTEAIRQDAMDVLAQYVQLKELQDDAADEIDMGEVVRDSLGNFKTKWTRPKDQVDAMRKTRAAAAQEAKQTEQLATAAKIGLNAKPENLNMLKDAVTQGNA